MDKYYSSNASALYAQYRTLDSEVVHRQWIDQLPAIPGLACDIGAGSGRDSDWLARLGWDVVAVEPCKELRELGWVNSHKNVTWLDDKLPELKKLRAGGYRFNIILISAVWMHLPPTERERAFRIVTELLAPGGILVITLRHGKDEAENLERNFHSVNAEELQNFARQRAVIPVVRHQDIDKLGRTQVRWETLAFKLPDDGTGSLPLLRHIIVNDNKAATYKLGLLRALIRIAEGAPGVVLDRCDDYVDIPLGLVGLYWVKLYMPLVLQHKLAQAPNHKPYEKTGLGFARPNHFYQLDKLSPFDLRIGSALSSDIAPVVIGAIKDACVTIQNMPAKYITFPGQSDSVFQVERRSSRYKNGSWQINKESLSEFGVFRIPASLWQSMGQYACWLEPTIINEWTNLMVGYEKNPDRNAYTQALLWEEGKRDTSKVRARVEVLQFQDRPVHCVWTNSTLKEKKYEIDHCFPWSRWSNNDLWNLLPASIAANGKKSEKLPSASLMHNSRTRILEWWEDAYVEDDMRQQFYMEAEAALPLMEKGQWQTERLFEAMLHQRAKLKANQQLQEWSP
jgi:SAM-dependent methyltransferase